MFIRVFISLFLFGSILGCSANCQTVESKKPILLADPTIFSHNGLYYLYGTVSGGMDSASYGFPVYTSTDLINWEGPSGVNKGFALVKDDVFGDKGFWAPQVFSHNNQFYMAYTANENIAFAIAESPLGPFIGLSNNPLKSPVRIIDPFVFFDDNGKVLLYHVRLQDGNRLFVSELNSDFLSMKPETTKFSFKAELSWENTQNVNWSVVEGPTTIKHKGYYYLIYSANDFRNPDYAVGYAVSDSPYGPWEKAKEPIIESSVIGEAGPGHGDVFFDDSGNMFYVFHTHYSKDTVRPRRTAIVQLLFKENNDYDYDQIIIKEETFRFLYFQ